MRLLLRLRSHLPNGFYRQSLGLTAIGLNLSNLNVHPRHFGQPARKEEDNDVDEVAIDQRRLPADFDPATFDPTEHRSPPSERVFKLVDELASLTLAESAELGPILMKKMRLKEMPTVGYMKASAAANLAGMAAKAPTAAKEEKKQEKTVFDLKLES